MMPNPSILTPCWHVINGRLQLASFGAFLAPPALFLPLPLHWPLTSGHFSDLWPLATIPSHALCQSTLTPRRLLAWAARGPLLIPNCQKLSGKSRHTQFTIRFPES